MIQRPLNEYRYTKQVTNKTHIVTHWTVGRIDSVDNSFQNNDGNTSYHFIIGQDGSVRQFLDMKYVAHHAGTMTWNRKAVGIAFEAGWLENGERVNPTQEAYNTAIELYRYVAQTYDFNLSSDTVKRHSDVRLWPTMCSGTVNVEYIIQEVNNVTIEPMTETQAVKIASEAYYEVFGYPPTQISIMHDARLLQKGERTKQSLKQSYVTEIEIARTKGNPLSDRAGNGFEIKSYLNNYPQIQEVLNVTLRNAHNNRKKIYDHYIIHGINEGRTDTPINE